MLFLVIWILLGKRICRCHQFYLTLCYQMNVLRFFRLIENNLVLIEVKLLEAVENFLNATLSIGVQVWHALIH